VVLRTLWRVKDKNQPLGVGSNKVPGHQQLLSHLTLVIWLESNEEQGYLPTLEQRVEAALDPDRRGEIDRFGGLSFGESTHLVDEVSPLNGDRKEWLRDRFDDSQCHVFLLSDSGSLTLPVWVDHVGSKGTRHVVGDLVETDLSSPDPLSIPQIQPKAE